ncbi:hypothetical protein ACJX0J_008790, partial [Zea mays]
CFCLQLATQEIHRIIRFAVWFYPQYDRNKDILRKNISWMSIIHVRIELYTRSIVRVRGYGYLYCVVIWDGMGWDGCDVTLWILHLIVRYGGKQDRVMSTLILFYTSNYLGEGDERGGDFSPFNTLR